MPTVLVADGDRETRAVHAWLLSSYGLEVERAGDSLECLAKLRRSLPDLLLLDLELPWGGGDNVLGVLREAPPLLPTRVVLTSAVAPAHGRDRLAWPPVVQAFTKPFQLSAQLERAALAAFLEHEQRSSGTQPDPMPADQVRSGLPAASSVTGGSFWEGTPSNTTPNSRADRESGKPLGCPSWSTGWK